MKPLTHKDDFPIFKNNPLIYLDSAATSQKPTAVLDAERYFYEHNNANIHRASYTLANKATLAYENARQKVAQFLGAKSSNEIVFLRGTTEAINLIAHSYVKTKFRTVIISELEHHANIIPWQLIGKTHHHGLEVVSVNENFEINIDEFEYLCKTHPNSFVSLLHVSNSFGSIYPIAKLIKIAHLYACQVLIDGAQAIAHLDVNVSELDADFYTFSGHKLYAGTGIGVLYAKEKYLQQFTPYQGGGAMIDNVNFKQSTFLQAPHQLEAGTPNIVGAVSLTAAIDYVQAIGLNKITEHENTLYDYAYIQLQKIDEVKLFKNRSTPSTSALSFMVKNIHHEDIALLLDKQHIAIRSGHHCTQPIMHRLGISGTLRVSFALYNTKQDIDKFILALKKSIKILKA